MVDQQNSGFLLLESLYTHSWEKRTIYSKRKECSSRLDALRGKLNRLNAKDKTMACVRRKLERAFRFFRSDEYGACMYELDCIEQQLK